MQEKTENILSSTDKMNALRDMLIMWVIKVKEYNMDMFTHVAAAKNKEIMPLISEHLEVLEKQIQHYFPNMCTDKFDWLRNPFIALISSQSQLSLTEEEELVEMCNDCNLQLKHIM